MALDIMAYDYPNTAVSPHTRVMNANSSLNVLGWDDMRVSAQYPALALCYTLIPPCPSPPPPVPPAPPAPPPSPPNIQGEQLSIIAYKQLTQWDSITRPLGIT
jgi:hypothetical protein